MLHCVLRFVCLSKSWMGQRWNLNCGPHIRTLLSLSVSVYLHSGLSNRRRDGAAQLARFRGQTARAGEWRRMKQARSSRRRRRPSDLASRLPHDGEDRRRLSAAGSVLRSGGFGATTSRPRTRASATTRLQRRRQIWISAFLKNLLFKLAISKFFWDFLELIKLN